MKVTRRRLLDLAIRAASLPASAAFFSNWLNAQHNHSSDAPPEPSYFADYQPKFFNPEDFEALAAFTEILIPTDDTPGARDAHCAAFMDFVLHASGTYAPETQDRWRQALRTLKTAGFHAANPAGRAALVDSISKPERDGSPPGPAFAAYRLIKRENAFAFYTSREGMISCLDYRGNSYNLVFPACTHPEHHVI